MAIIFASAVVMVWYSNKPLYHSDLWGHLSYGRWMWEHGRLPESEPLMPLASEVPMLATAWLTQLSAFLVSDFAGLHGLQVGYGLLIAVTFTFVCNAAKRHKQTTLWPVIAGAVFVFVLRWQLVIIRPQLVGLCCFATLVYLLESDTCGRRVLGGIASLFVLWANSHPSFPAGLILLTIYAVTRCVQLAASGSLREIAADSQLRWMILFGLTAGVAVLLNPYGFDAYLETFRVSGNPNLRDLKDWQPSDLSSKFAVGFLVSLPTVAVTWLTAKERRWPLFVATVLTAVVTFFSKRMLCWYAVLSAVSIGSHAASRFTAQSSVRRFGLGSVAAIAVFVVAVSPVWRVCLPIFRQSLREVATGQTPVEATAFLVENYAGEGLVWTPNTWGDFVTWQSETAVPVMVNSHAHLIPRAIWQDYRCVSLGEPDCCQVLDKHNVQWVLAGSRRDRLLERLKVSGQWSVAFKDSRATILRRDR